jgi:hypothetical protein
MSYFIFTKNTENSVGGLYRIAENQSDLDNLNIFKSDYKILEVSQTDFNLIKFQNKFPLIDNNYNISYINLHEFNFEKNALQNQIKDNKKIIKEFLDNNPNHSLFNRWNNYYNQLQNLNLDSIIYPLNKSLEQYFNDLGQLSLNILQIP